MRRGQLLSNGRLGKLGGYVYVDAIAVIDRLTQDGSDVMLTIKPKYEKERHMLVDNKHAVWWVNAHQGYTYEAWYDGKDKYMHVTAIQS